MTGDCDQHCFAEGRRPASVELKRDLQVLNLRIDHLDFRDPELQLLNHAGLLQTPHGSLPFAGFLQQPKVWVKVSLVFSVTRAAFITPPRPPVNQPPSGASRPSCSELTSPHAHILRKPRRETMTRGRRALGSAEVFPSR